MFSLVVTASAEGMLHYPADQARGDSSDQRLEAVPGRVLPVDLAGFRKVPLGIEEQRVRGHDRLCGCDEVPVCAWAGLPCDLACRPVERG
jgi:hypothetical protein